MDDPLPPDQSHGSQTSQSQALYTLHGVVVATVLGSLAAAVVIVCLNYWKLGAQALARKVAIAGGALYLLVIGLSSLLPGSLEVGLAMVAVQAGLGYALANQLQGSTIRYHVANGGRAHSNFRAAGVGLGTGFAIFFVAIFVLALFQVGAPAAA